MVLIGVDPHKASHTAVVVDAKEQQLGVLQVRADRRQLERLLAWAEPFGERTWAIESAGGLGYLLAQQLIAAKEHVVDVPPTLAARVRLLGSGRASKNDPNDALSTAVAALRHPGLRVVVAEDYATVLRLLADRHQDLTALRTQAVCRLHAVLAMLMPGSALGRELSAAQAAQLLRRVHSVSAVEAARRQLAVELIADVRRLDASRAEAKRRINVAVVAAATSVTDVYGVGPVVAALLIGHAGDVGRFPSKDHFASYNGTAPIEASSGPKTRHRLNPRGNRQLNHALHLAAVTQVRNDTPGRAYYLRKQAEGKTRKEAMRSLKRRVSDAVYRQLLLDAQR
jgi:transposase